MRKFLMFFLLGVVLSLHAGPTNSILFVTQVQVPGDFTSIGSTFGNQKPGLDSCGRGGDLYIRYPDGTVRNLTRAAGYGLWGEQSTNGIAVRQPSVYWNGKKAVFSMVVGAPRHQFDYTSVSYWQLYEITNFTKPSDTPIITKVPNQPANFNNVAPIYGTDDRIIFTSDRPRNGQTNLYPQLDEYEEAPTVTGLWSLQPTNGDLFMMNHTPSGAFSPLIDQAGRVIFVRWDHLQRDQQADTDWEEHNHGYGAFNWSDESTNSVTTTNLTEVFPEARPVRTDLLPAGLFGETFNQFFPWSINEDGTGEETVNHVGRHELGGSYINAAYTNDPNIDDLYYFGDKFNTNTIGNFLQIREDPRVAGLFYGIDAPEFGTHAAGQIISMTGSTNLNADEMQITFLTPYSTRSPASDSNSIPADDTGAYRNPLMTTDGYFIATHSSFPLGEIPSPAGETNGFPGSSYDFRLKFLQLSNGFYVPGAPLTVGLTNWAWYYDPDALVTQTNTLWEFDPVEVVGRPRPARVVEQIQAPELAAFATAGVNVNAFQNYLRTHELALIISRDVTTRDHADRQQPFNLRVAGTEHQTIGADGKIYDIDSMQLFQADQLRGLNHGSVGNPGNGRRVIAQYLHEPAVDNPNTPLLASVKIGPDGSQAAIVPARRAMSWQLTDTNGVGVVRERYWLTFAPGEIRTCTSCHGINETNQAGQLAPTNSPQALVTLLNYWKTNTAVKSYMAADQGTNYLQISFVHHPAESGVTYHVQKSTDLVNWADIASYSGSNSVLTVNAKEISKIGSPSETVTIRDSSCITGRGASYLRVNVSRP